MCGIAGYSLSPGSKVDRTLAAQALLAAIAERGADAVGYAYRSVGAGYPVVVKQRTPASHLLERVAVPDAAAKAAGTKPTTPTRTPMIETAAPAAVRVLRVSFNDPPQSGETQMTRNSRIAKW